ncbi:MULTISPECIES: hypothetical protein [unclassified Streptomyces]|uniref:hypothetical protein n=1 Tax=unclassified Streptomyces TaxID=2593676 RepID=UPI00036091F1|nr:MULTISPECIES: hypothetical protein [unclassified Streptomyces]MYY03083.1 hypothetical protein [Streptomyces sp. SID4913]
MATIDAGDLSPEAAETETQLQRIDLFRRAHALVTDLEWGDTVGVYDVLQVARFLEGKPGIHEVEIS